MKDMFSSFSLVNGKGKKNYGKLITETITEIILY